METDVESDPFDYRSHPVHPSAQGQMAHLSSYYRWTLEAFGQPLVPPIVDAGAGAGHLAEVLLEGGLTPIVLLEGGAENVAVLVTRFDGVGAVEIVDCDLGNAAQVLAGRAVKTIVTLDVLEHLPDDVAVLEELYAALEVGGRVFVKVPAHRWLYGAVDAASGHYRRYSKHALSRALSEAGFEVEVCKYMNMAGVAPYFVKSRVLRRRTSFSGTFTDTQLRRIERSIPKLRTLDRLFGPPVGLSVVAVARKVV